jgi:anti-sigma factor RsiW
MATHRATSPDLAGYVLGILDPGQAESFEVHLGECPHCRAEVEELREVPALLAVGDTQVEVPGDLHARTFARIRADEAPTAEPPLVLPRLGHRPSGASPARSVRIGPRARRLASAAAVAATVIGLGGGVTALIRTGDWGNGVGAASIASGENEPPTEPGATGAPVTTLSLVAPRNGRQHGAVTIRTTAARRVVQLRVTALAPPGAGHRYVCWFVGRRDTHSRPDRVVIGSFVTDGSGRATPTFTTAADPTRYPLVDVTNEAGGVNPQKRGPKVLTAPPHRDSDVGPEVRQRGAD